MNKNLKTFVSGVVRCCYHGDLSLLKISYVGAKGKGSAKAVQDICS